MSSLQKNNLIYSRDDIPAYLPQKPRFVILGTMAAINARHIEGQKPPETPYFFYNNSKNRFWQYLWQIFEGKTMPDSLSISDKKLFCERRGIAICNLLGEMKIEKKDASDRTDTIIFRANKDGIVKTKIVEAEFKKALETLPIFFTCYHKKELQTLIELFFMTNEIETGLVNRIHYLHTPAMPGRVDVLALWKKAFENFVIT